MIGNQYGNLTVIEATRKENGKLAWLCNCKCGETTIATTNGLNKGDNTSCGCLRNSGGRPVDDIVNQVFGNFTVLSREGTCGKNGNTTWLCKCKCGKTKVIQRGRLVGNKPIYCECSGRLSNLPIIERLFKRYKYNATEHHRRNIEFTLTQQEFEDLVFKDCHYCGEPPFLKFKTVKETIIHGGIDRVNNSRGYHNDNCVPCCQHCNAMKLQLSYQDFIEKIHRIAERHSILRTKNFGI